MAKVKALTQPKAVIVDDWEAAKLAADHFPEHQKIQSWLLLWRLNLPTLKGVIFAGWSPEVESLVRRFANKYGYHALLIRSDRAPETGDYLPGGDIVSLDRLAEAVAKYLSLGRILFLLEPRSRFEDLYSLSVGFANPNEATVEIVGPGFDASDLKRGDTTPHEWLKLDIRDDAATPNIIQHRIVSDAEYQRGWAERLEKVAHLIRRELQIESEFENNTTVSAANWLLKNGYPLLLDGREKYQPIPAHLLDEVLGQCQRLPAGLRALGRQEDAFVISLSLVGRQAQKVYWDIVWPSRKFEIGERKQATS